MYQDEVLRLIRQLSARAMRRVLAIATNPFITHDDLEDIPHTFVDVSINLGSDNLIVYSVRVA